MKVPARLKEYLTSLLIALAVTAGVGVVVLVISGAGKSIGLDIFLDMAGNIFLLGFCIYLLKSARHTSKLWLKIGLVLFMGFIVFSTVNGIVAAWPRLPWIKARAFTTVDMFMTALKEKDYTTAMTKLTPRMQQCVRLDDLSNPNAQPVHWKLDGMDELSNIWGNVTFSDGQELSLVVRMAWSDSQWLINGFWFGGGAETRLDYSSMHCGE